MNCHAAPIPSPPIASRDVDLPVAMRNIRLMHLLTRLAERFTRAGVDLMALKGAALNLALPLNPADRPMGDLDLMVRPEDLPRAMALLEEAGCRRSQVLVRADFFPHLYYEAEFIHGSLAPATIDLHARPFRPLRYAQLVPDDGLWRHAQPATVGDGVVHLPGREDMLLHLSVHCAIHGCSGDKWLQDLRSWTRAHPQLDWDQFVASADRWRLALPALTALEAAEAHDGLPLIPNAVRTQLRRGRVNWRDQLTLWHAPYDNTRRFRGAIVAAITAPRPIVALRYAAAVALPGREHMREWYGREHTGWLAAAHALRWLRPLRLPVGGAA